MEKSKFTQIVLFISGVIAIAVAGMIQISPVDFYATNNIDIAENVNLLNEIRASSGALLAYGIFILTGVFIDQLRFTAIVLSTLLFLSYGLSRFVSVFIDGMPVNSLIGAGVIEILVGLFCLFCLWKYRDR